MPRDAPEAAQASGLPAGREAAVPPALLRLRAATAEAHAAIEAVPRLSRLRDGLRDVADYVETLRRYRAHFAAHEAGIAAILAPHVPLGFFAPRTRLPLIEADLAALGVALSPVPPPADAPSGPAEAAGWLYVHEGSTLGGLFLQRRVREALGEGVAPATAFLTGHGRGTAFLWQESRQVIAALLPDRAAEAAAAEGAARAFAVLARRMAEERDAPAPDRPAGFRPALTHG